MLVNFFSNHHLNFNLKVRLLPAKDHALYRECRLHFAVFPLVGHGVDLLLVLVELREDLALSHFEFGVDRDCPVVSAVQKFGKRLSEMFFALGEDGFEGPDADVVEGERHRHGLELHFFFHAVGETFPRGDNERFSVFLSDGYFSQASDVDGRRLGKFKVSKFREFREFHLSLYS